QWLFDEHVLAVLEAVANEVELRLVRNAGKDGVVAIKRHVAQALVVGFFADRIDRANVVAARKALPLAALNAHSGNNYTHGSRFRGGPPAFPRGRFSCARRRE